MVTNPETIQKLSETSPYAKCAARAQVVFVPCYRKEGLVAPMYVDIDLSAAVEILLLETNGNIEQDAAPESKTEALY